MKDLKVYYQTEYPNAGPISKDFDRRIENLARRYGLSFQGSGFDMVTNVRDLHYAKEEVKK